MMVYQTPACGAREIFNGSIKITHGGAMRDLCAACRPSPRPPPYFPFRPRPKPSPYRKKIRKIPMTILVGLKFSNGVVFATDSQAPDFTSTTKWNDAEKI